DRGEGVHDVARAAHQRPRQVGVRDQARAGSDLDASFADAVRTDLHVLAEARRRVDRGRGMDVGHRTGRWSALRLRRLPEALPRGLHLPQALRWPLVAEREPGEAEGLHVHLLAVFEAAQVVTARVVAVLL